MDYIAQNDKAIQADIESGGGFVHRDSGESPVPSVKQQAKMFIAKLYGTSVDPPENRVSSLTNSVDGNAASVEKGEANEGRNDVEEEKKVVKQKQKPASAKKPPRPPRPPKAPSLDAADKKLIREIAELARLKRARIERMKALRKTKASKAPSSNGGNAIGFLFTIIFGFLIILQGMPSRGRPADYDGSRVREGAADGTKLASAQFLGYPPAAANNPNGPVSSSPNSLEQVTGLDPQEKLRYSATGL